MAALLMIVFSLWPSFLRGAVWQWSIKVNSVVSPETNKPPRAFLWIPPGCVRVRGVVVGQHNMLEEGILEHPDFRRELSALGFAEVWITPGLDFVYNFEKGAGNAFDEMMHLLAEESGYKELDSAPIAPIGHSAAASFPWNFAAANPQRTLAILSIKGDAPLTSMTGSGRPNPAWGERRIDGIPGLMVMGEYEWLAGRLSPATEFQKNHPKTPISVLCDAGHGHFDLTDPLVHFLALFLHKAAVQRLPAESAPDKPVALKPISPREGWLVDSGRITPPRVPAARFADYTGDRDEAFWAFDEELAHAIENYGAQAWGKAPQLLGFSQNGRVVPQNPKTHAQVALALPPLDENLTFHLRGVFMDTVPAGNPEKWSGLAQGSPISHSSDAEALQVSRICGPVVQTGPDTFAIRFYRMGLDNPRRTGDIWLLAHHPGDEKFKSAVQQANLRIPIKNTSGAPQTIDFQGVPNQPRKTRSLQLHATSSAGLPVYFYVREGPAELEGDTLVLTEVPARAKLPIKVTVVAWQWGRTTHPQIQSAEPIEQTFTIGE